MTEGLVSVIIPTYNRGSIIHRSIDSVLSQTYSHCEIIIIDDGSNDDTKKNIEQKYGTNPKIVYFYKKNGGVSSARNLGLKKAQGEFIAFLDSDDAWYPDKIKTQVLFFKKCPEVGMIWTDFSAVDPNGSMKFINYLKIMYDTYRFFPNKESLFSREYQLNELTQEQFEHIPSDISLYTGNIFSQMVLGNLVHTSTVMFRHELLTQIGQFDETLKVCEDYKFHLKTTSITNIGFIDYPLVAYCIMGEDALTSNQYTLQIAENFLIILKESLHNYRDRIKLPRSIVSSRLADTYCWVGSEHANLNNSSKALSFFIKSIFVKPNQTNVFKQIIKLMLKKVGIRQ